MSWLFVLITPCEGSCTILSSNNPRRLGHLYGSLGKLLFRCSNRSVSHSPREDARPLQWCPPSSKLHWGALNVNLVISSTKRIVNSIRAEFQLIIEYAHPSMWPTGMWFVATIDFPSFSKQGFSQSWTLFSADPRLFSMVRMDLTISANSWSSSELIGSMKVDVLLIHKLI